MYNELMTVLNKWEIDVKTLSIKQYEKYIEILINGHYIYIIKK